MPRTPGAKIGEPKSLGPECVDTVPVLPGQVRMRADARRNRALILDAAKEAFAKDGLGVPVDEIARRAGVGAGTLYRHFPTKEALFVAIVVEHMAHLADEARELADNGDPATALFEFISRLGEEASTKRDLMEALYGAGIDLHEACAQQKEDIDRSSQKLLERAQEAGVARPDVTVADVFGLVVGMCSVGGGEVAGCSQTRMLTIVCDGLRPTQ